MRSIFVTLPVKNLQVSTAFFTELGFAFDPELSGSETACMTIDRNVSVLLSSQEHFEDSINGDLSHTRPVGGFLTCLSAENEQAVDDILAKAIAAGGKPWPVVEDRPGYSGTFQDLDGYLWQLTCQRESVRR